MNDIKISCIDSRRNAIESSYTGNDEKILNEINNYFKKLEEFAKNCSDVSDFETKFQASPLSQEYTNLFTKIMGGNIDMKKEAKDLAKYTTEEVIDDITHTARINAREEVDKELRNVPIIGDIMTTKQHFDLF